MGKLFLIFIIAYVLVKIIQSVTHTIHQGNSYPYYSDDEKIIGKW